MAVLSMAKAGAGAAVTPAARETRRRSLGTGGSSIMWICGCCGVVIGAEDVWCVEVEEEGKRKFAEEGRRQWAAAEVGHMR
jgi:hypothetical protein